MTGLTTPLKTLLLVGLLGAFGFQGTSAQTEVRIGYQRGNILGVLKEQGFIEQALGDDVRVTWTLFSAGPPLHEAMNAGAIDFGLTGDAPPVFAQAAGVPFVYTGSQVTLLTEAVLVPEGSSVSSVADLAGQQVGYTVESSANYLFVKALESAGLTPDDVEGVPLQPADARATFQGGNLDAWVIWDPFLTAAVQELGARTLLTRTDLKTEYRWFYLASGPFAETQPELLNTVLAQVQVATDWVRDNPDGFAGLLTDETGIEAMVWSEILASRTFEDPEPMTPEPVDVQQVVADTFLELGTLPAQVAVQDIVWTWQPERAAR